MFDSSESYEKKILMAYQNYRKYHTPHRKNKIKSACRMCQKCKDALYLITSRRGHKEFESLKTCTKCCKRCVLVAYHRLCPACSIDNNFCVVCCNSMEPQAVTSTTVKELSSEAAVNKIYQSLSGEKQQMFLRFLSNSSKKESYGFELNMTQGDIYRKLKALKLSDKKKCERKCENEYTSSRMKKYSDMTEDY